MKELTERLFSKYYRMAENGKMELFGIDGLNHAFYAFLIMSGVAILSRWLTPFYAFIVTVLFCLAIIVGFFIMEMIQELHRLQRHTNDHVKMPIFWFTKPNAQLNDWLLPSITSLLCLILILVFVV